MKLLMIDDEKLSRDGLVQSIQWETLGINELLQAEDGISGLELARQYRPEIVLSDVRMPRLNGIQLIEKLMDLIPDSSFIFMSGYSDKEYLKAAIRFHAVGYLEKPLDLEELKDTVQRAVLRVNKQTKTRPAETSFRADLSSKLALLLTYPHFKQEELEPCLNSDPFFSLEPELSVVTFLVKCMAPVYEIGEEPLKVIHLRLQQFSSDDSLRILYAVKPDYHIVYHLFHTTPLPPGLSDRIAAFLKEQFHTAGKFYIAIGETASSLSGAYSSYLSAVLLMQSSFYYDYNCVLSGSCNADAFCPVPPDPAPAFWEALNAKKPEKALLIAEQTCRDFQSNPSLLPNLVKDIYYKLFVSIQTVYKTVQNANLQLPFLSVGIIGYLNRYHTLLELNQALIENIILLFDCMLEPSSDNSTIHRIKDFIHGNYSNPELSVKTISEHVYLSASYACSLFRTETGRTLNQYITDFRIAQAKILLANPKYTMTDISVKVGYRDSNYFGKSFKKSVGTTPSEYRERILT